MSGTHNPTPTITLQSTLAELLKIATSSGSSKSIARFDFGNDRAVAVCAFVDDSEAYLSVCQIYEDNRDRYANRVANAVAEHIEKHGMPDKDNPQPFNLIKSSDGEEGAQNDA